MITNSQSHQVYNFLNCDMTIESIHMTIVMLAVCVNTTFRRPITDCKSSCNIWQHALGRGTGVLTHAVRLVAASTLALSLTLTLALLYTLPLALPLPTHTLYVVAASHHPSHKPINRELRLSLYCKLLCGKAHF
jgi:hypothetical protein